MKTVDVCRWPGRLTVADMRGKGLLERIKESLRDSENKFDEGYFNILLIVAVVLLVTFSFGSSLVQGKSGR